MLHLQDFGHECDRFRVFGLRCPFGGLKEDEEDEDEEEEEEGQKAERVPLMLPARRRSDADAQRELRNVTDIAVAPKELREALERLAAIKQRGAMRSIPELPFGGRGHPETFAALAAIALMTVFRALRKSGFGAGLRAVRIGEKHVSKGFSRVVRPQASAGPGRTMGRGGLHVNAAADLRNLLFGRKQRRRGGGVIPPGGGPK